MKVALVYDRVNKWGGAERVLLALHKIFPDAPLYTSVYNPKKAKWASVFEVKTSFLQYFPNASSSHESYALLMPLAFESFSFNNYDLVISVTSESAKGIITKPGTFHICYCLTPTRYLWSGHEQYFQNPLFRLLTKPAVSYLKKWDLQASVRPDKFIAISDEVRGRIKKYYGRESEIIYPPVGIENIKSQISEIKQKGQGYFLIVSRLVPYKNIEIAIKACNSLNLPLNIVGVGLEEKRLKKIAGKTIEFLGEVSDQDLVNLYSNCRALIFPGNEDFGLVMVEAQAFGRPVIALRAGGALEIVREGLPGKFFNRQTEKSLKEVLVKFNENRYNNLLCRKNAEKFSFPRFKKELLDFLENKLDYN